MLFLGVVFVQVCLVVVCCVVEVSCSCRMRIGESHPRGVKKHTLTSAHSVVFIVLSMRAVAICSLGSLTTKSGYVLCVAYGSQALLLSLRSGPAVNAKNCSLVCSLNRNTNKVEQ